jgi:SAM-dependent methyltransferase
MVDALREAHRVLRPGGVVADLRPERDPGNRRRRYLRVEIRWDGRRVPVGTVGESTEYTSDYIASDRAVARVLRDGLFWLERSELFWLRTHFRDLPTVDRYLAAEWTGMGVPKTTRQSLLRQLRRHPRARIVAADLFRLNILRKLP